MEEISVGHILPMVPEEQKLSEGLVFGDNCLLKCKTVSEDTRQQ